MTSFNVNINVFSTSNVSAQSTNANVTNIKNRRQRIDEQDHQRLVLSLQKSTSSKSNESCIDGDETESDPEVKETELKKMKNNKRQSASMRNLREIKSPIEVMMKKEKDAAYRRAVRNTNPMKESDKGNINPKRRQRQEQSSQSSSTRYQSRPMQTYANISTPSISTANRSTSTTVSLDSPNLPTVAQLENFEQEPNAALLLFHETSGAHASLIASTSEIDPNDDVPVELKTTVESMKPIDAAKTQKIIKQFQSVMDKYQVIQACASCGMRSAPGTENPIKFIQIDSSEAQTFLFTDFQLHELSLKSPI